MSSTLYRLVESSACQYSATLLWGFVKLYTRWVPVLMPGLFSPERSTVLVSAIFKCTKILSQQELKRVVGAAVGCWVPAGELCPKPPAPVTVVLRIAAHNEYRIWRRYCPRFILVCAPTCGGMGMNRK